MDASTEFSPMLINASKNETFEESSNASMFWFVSMESTQEPVITLFPSLKENLRVCFFLSASKVSPQEEISRAPIREDQNQVVLSVVSGGASIRFSQDLGFPFNSG